MYCMKVLYAEHLKSKRTMLSKIPFVLSILVAACILFVLRTTGKEAMVSGSMHYWSNLSSMVMPLLAGILAGLMGEQEQEAGNYQVIRKSIHKGQNFFLKCLYLLSRLTFFVFFSILLLYIGIWCMYHPDNFTVFLFLKTAVIFIIGSLFLVPFQLWSSFYFGIGASIGFGIFGTIFVTYVSSLPVLEERVWRFIPWTWSMKTADLYFEHRSLWVQGAHLPLDLIIQLLGSALLCIGTLLWFKKWEGKANG